MNVTPEIAQRIREASQWVGRHNGRELSAAEMQDWSRWSSGPLNRAEYSAIVLLVAHLRSLSPILPSDEELKTDLEEEIVLCPYCGRLTHKSHIEPPVDYCHHDVLPGK